MKNDLGNLSQLEINKLNILNEKTYTGKLTKKIKTDQFVVSKY